MLFLPVLIGLASAVSLDTSSSDSVCAAAKKIVDGEFDYYEGTRYGGTVGMFQEPYYWWQAGEAFTGLIDYYTYCDSSNDTLRDIIKDAILHQAGPDYDFKPSNQTSVEANDDQGMWGMALMQAVERGFPEDSDHTWLELVENVYDQISGRWDSDTCSGGVRWQIESSMNGYTYKNSITNGILFNLAARLAKYTKKDKYKDEASKVWDWMKNDVEYIVKNGSVYDIYDGAHTDENCQDFDTTKWSYIYGVFISGNAYLYNYTEDDQWLQNAQDLFTLTTKIFFTDKVMYEPSCMDDLSCSDDQRAFRSLFARFLRLSGLVASDIDDDIEPYLKATAEAAAQSCSGGSDGSTCGQNWSKDGWDGVYGLGEQMSALEAILAMVVGYPK